MYVLWKLFNNPDEKVLIVSASVKSGEPPVPWLLKTIGDVQHGLGTCCLTAMTAGTAVLLSTLRTCKHIEQSPSVRAAGIVGQITGSRASTILCDDPETPTA